MTGRRGRCWSTSGEWATAWLKWMPATVRRKRYSARSARQWSQLDCSKNRRRVGEDAAQRPSGVAGAAEVEGDGGGGGQHHGPRSDRREDDRRCRGEARI